jgi:hypothetical protein
MSLKYFHVFFISLTVLLLLGGGWMAYSSYQNEPSRAAIDTAWTCLGTAVFLLLYGFAFLRKIRKITT